MRRPHGVGTWLDPSADRPLLERDSVTCGHCGRVVFVKPGTAATVYLVTHRDGRLTEEPGAGCRVCMHAICLSCCAVGTCTPLERQLEEAERGARILGAR